MRTPVNCLRFLSYVFYHSVILRQQLIRHWRFVEKYQWEDRSFLDGLQRRKLKALLLHCHNNVPYYRRLFSDIGIKEESFEGQSVLGKIPFLTKRIIRQSYNELRAQNMSEREYKKNSTSGSTGESLFLSDG